MGRDAGFGGRGSCSTPIRTGTERTKNSSAAITPWNIHNYQNIIVLICGAKVGTFFIMTKCLDKKNATFLHSSLLL